MSVLVIPGSHTILHWLPGFHQRDRLWRLGGIALDCKHGLLDFRSDNPQT